MMVGMNTMQVFLLVGKQTGTVSVWASKEDAEARRDKFNADPWVEPGNPDQDAPYEVQAWNVQVAQ